jgi:hypothetical protein
VRAQGAIDASTAAMEMHSIPLREHVVAKLMGKRAASIRLTKNKQESTEKDSACLSRGGERMTWSQIRAHAEDCDGKHSSGESLAPGCERAIEHLCDDVGGRSRLQWYVVTIQAKYNPLPDAAVRRPLTASVAELPCPTLMGTESPGTGDTGNVTVVLDNEDRELQRIVSAHRYYGSETKCQDNMMIEESNDAPQGSPSSPMPRTVYIAKVQAFLAIKNHRRVLIMVKRRQGGQADQSAENEICHIHYYCRVGAASIDAVDRALNCVKIRWSAREGKEAAAGGPPTVDDEPPSVADVACIDAQPVAPLEAFCMLRVGTMSFECCKPGARQLTVPRGGPRRSFCPQSLWSRKMATSLTVRRRVKQPTSNSTFSLLVRGKKMRYARIRERRRSHRRSPPPIIHDFPDLRVLSRCQFWITDF